MGDLVEINVRGDELEVEIPGGLMGKYPLKIRRLHNTYPGIPILTSGFERAMPAIWSVESQRIYHLDRLWKSIEQLLSEEKISKQSPILDVSGGIGFPYVLFLWSGYTTDYNDGSPYMLEATRRQLAQGQREFGIGPRNVFCKKWQDFEFNEEYDFLLCMGNSLPHAAGWGGRYKTWKEAYEHRHEAEESIVLSLRKFHRSLRHGGLLYVDRANRDGFETVGEIATLVGEAAEEFGKEADLIVSPTAKEVVLNQEVINARGIREWSFLIAEREYLWEDPKKVAEFAEGLPGKDLNLALAILKSDGPQTKGLRMFRTFCPFYTREETIKLLEKAGFSIEGDVWLNGQEGNFSANSGNVRILGEASEVTEGCVAEPIYPGLLARKK